MMLTDTEIAEGRAIAESTMDAECAVIRKLGTTTDPNTGAVVNEWATVYTGICALEMTSESGLHREAGEQTVTLTRIQLKLPWTEDALQVGDRAVITASRRSPGNAGRAVQIDGPWVQSTAAACRYPCIESTVPEAA